MKASELRIGNWVDSELRNMQIELVDFADILKYYNANNLDHMKPIPLTEEWLEKFGFKPFVKDWQRKGIIIHTRKRGFVLRKSVPIIKHVHQLQNLYFALTGEELTIKE